jgi:hypothetical protein
LQKELKVIPARVVEQTVTRTLDGEKTSFSVVVPSSVEGSPQKKYPLNKLNAKVYISAEHARKAMIENATNKINIILSAAEGLAQSSFGYERDSFPTIESGTVVVNEADENVSSPSETNTIYSGNDVIDEIIASDEMAEVDLGNGMKARINPKNIIM